MGLNIRALNSNIYSPNFKAGKTTQPAQQKQDSTNPISKKGETLNLIKATFIGGLGLGARLLWEIWDCDFLFEKAGEAAEKIVEKNKAGARGNKKLLLCLGAAAALVGAAISGFALLYTIANAPKINYNSKINNFEKSKKMDVYIKANEAEKELYSQLNDKAKNSTQEEKEKLKEQYMQLKMAKNQTPDFIEIKQPKKAQKTA